METATLTKTKWTLDPTHSEIGFKVKTHDDYKRTGSFGKFDVQAQTEVTIHNGEYNLYRRP